MSEVQSKTASEFFGGWGADYDAKIAQAVPRYEEMLDQVLDVVPAHLADGDVLELGTGSGALTLRFLQRYPMTTLATVDGSQEMLALTTRRVEENFGSLSVAFHLSRFEDLDLPAESVDLILSSISLHHIEDKGRFFARAFGWLRSGGALVFSDQMCGADDAITQRHWKRVLAYWDSMQMPACDVKDHLDHFRRHDHHESLVSHFRYLETAGFSRVDCTWRHLQWAVVLAVK